MANMAVSNALGSNIFDILICLGSPWFLSILIHGHDICYSAQGLIVFPVILFSSLLVVIGTFIAFKWVLQPAMGIGFLVLYGLFVIFVLLVNYLDLNLGGGG